MFNAATTAFLLATAASSVLAAPAINFKGPLHHGCDGCALPNPAVSLFNKFNKVARNADFEVREPKGGASFGKAAGSIGGQAANGAAGALTTWALNKIREEDIEAREPKGFGGAAVKIGGQAAGGAGGALATWALNKLGRDDLEDIEARGIGATIAKDLGKEAAKGAGGAAGNWVLGKIGGKRDLEAREPKGFGGAAVKIGGQAAGGVGGAVATWALNKIRDEEFVARFVNPALESLMNEAREDGIDIRGIFETLDARDFDDIEEYFY